MTQEQREEYLLQALMAEREDCQNLALPQSRGERWRLLRALMNVRWPGPVTAEFLEIQDAYLRQAIREKGITDYRTLTPRQEGLYLWRGDITTLKCGAIVNAANSQMLGCFCPNHGCIDNAIHTYAGVQLRAACAERMAAQGFPEPTGRAKLTPAFNLPCEYVLHTVGPIVRGRVTGREEGLLASCYRSCLALAEENEIGSVAFCCISTGEFSFPNQRAAEIAVKTVREYRAEKNSRIEVIFNVFQELDYRIYDQLLR